MILFKRITALALTLVLSCFFLLALEVTPSLEVAIPMRDGMELPTNIYFPDGKAGKYPCVLIRQPLGKESIDPNWFTHLKEGYVVAIQSTRSSCDETGKCLPYVTDGCGELADGYDTIEWLAKSEWTNGKVATIGTSATGITQLLLAPSAPPHLVCQYVEFAAPSLFQYAVWPGGQFRKEQVEGWLKVHKRDASVTDWIHKQAEYNSFWKQFNSIELADQVKVPQVHVGGWFDIFLQGTLDAFVASSENSLGGSSTQHKLIIGPWGHRWKQTKTFGDFEPLAIGAKPPHPVTTQDWLDYHMKGTKNSLATAPTVQYFVMGPFDGSASKGNEWRTAHKWPPDSRYAQMYLTQDKKIEGTQKGHSLQEESVPVDIATIDVLFDPENPVPTIGGRNLFIADGPKDLASIEKRADVVSFTTAPLDKDTEVTGRIAACFFISNILQERDVCCRVSDVYPDGKSILISEGLAHALPQASTSLNTPRPVLVDLWSTSMVFAKGHRIRLTVSGSNYPAYDTSLTANPNQAENSPNVCFSLHSGGDFPSYLALPIVKG